MKLKTLLRVFERSGTITIVEKRKWWRCPEQHEDCFDCEWHEDIFDPEDDTHNNNGCGICTLPEDKKIQEIEIYELYNGEAENAPYKLMEKNVVYVFAFIRGQGKNGRKKHGTEPVIEIEVTGEDD